MYEMLEGIPPFYDNDKEKLFANILNNPLGMPADLTPLAEDLLNKLLEKDPDRRLGTTGGADEIMKHPWFNKVDWTKVAKKEYKAPYPYLMKSKEEERQSSHRHQRALKKYNTKLRESEFNKHKDEDDYINGWSFQK